MTRIAPTAFGRRLRAPADRDGRDRRIGTFAMVAGAVLYAVTGDLFFPFFVAAFVATWRIGCAIIEG